MQADSLESAQRVKRRRGIEGVEQHERPIIVEPTEAAPATLFEQTACRAVGKGPNHDDTVGRLA